jgi:hypothetical protein
MFDARRPFRRRLRPLRYEQALRNGVLELDQQNVFDTESPTARSHVKSPKMSSSVAMRSGFVMPGIYVLINDAIDFPKPRRHLLLAQTRD